MIREMSRIIIDQLRSNWLVLFSLHLWCKRYSPSLVSYREKYTSIRKRGREDNTHIMYRENSTYIINNETISPVINFVVNQITNLIQADTDILRTDILRLSSSIWEIHKKEVRDYLQRRWSSSMHPLPVISTAYQGCKCSQVCSVELPPCSATS